MQHVVSFLESVPSWFHHCTSLSAFVHVLPGNADILKCQHFTDIKMSNCTNTANDNQYSLFFCRMWDSPETPYFD